MEQITQNGLQVAQDLGQRHGFSAAAVVHMMQAMLRSRGGMAQFNHPEFGGSGQWMPGGMVMVSDMFNNALKARVDGLCRDVSAALAAQPVATAAAGHSFQQQSGGGLQQQSAGGFHQQSTSPPATMPGVVQATAAQLFVPDPRDTWWPAELGAPTATGEQNNVRYAFFPNSGRLAVDVNGQVNVYDTGSHHIAGFSQQQGGGGGVVFSTPAGSVSLSSFSPTGGSSQQQQSSGGGFQHQSWWPAELGVPASSGAQNDLRYAIFPAAGRLAVEQNGRCRVFDVGDQAISGVSIRSATGELILSTPDGDRLLSHFPETNPTPQAPREPQAESSPATATTSAVTSAADDPYAALERLGALKAKGILTEEEFSSKKAELLGRL